MESHLIEQTQETIESYESAMYNLIQYMFTNSIFNTYVTTTDDDSHFSIILKTCRPKLCDLLGHLNKHIIIKKNDNILQEDCPICFEEYRIKQHVRSLDKCSHCFHKKCIDKWFRKNQGHMNCPICRTNYDKKLAL